jgi:hypothetical protein
MKKLFLTFLFFSIIFAPFALVNATTSDTSLVLQPAKTEIVANAGQPVLKTFIIINRSNFYLKLKLDVKDYKQKSDDGTLEFYDSKTEPASTWLIPQFTEIGLKPLETKSISFVVKTLENFSSGGHYGAILFEPIGNTPNLSTGNFGELVLLTSTGGSKASAVAKNITFGTTGLQQGNPVDFNFKIQNTGNTHFDTSGKVLVKDWLGNTIGNFNTGALTVYPGTTRVFKWRWQNTPGLGIYRADVSLADPNSSNPRLINGMWFVIFPWQITLAILLTLLAVFLILKYRQTIASIFKRRTIHVPIKVTGNEIASASLKEIFYR